MTIIIDVTFSLDECYFHTIGDLTTTYMCIW